MVPRPEWFTAGAWVGSGTYEECVSTNAEQHPGLLYDAQLGTCVKPSEQRLGLGRVVRAVTRRGHLNSWNKWLRLACERTCAVESSMEVDGRGGRTDVGILRWGVVAEMSDTPGPISDAETSILSQEQHSTYRSSHLLRLAPSNTHPHHQHTTCACSVSTRPRITPFYRGTNGGSLMPGSTARTCRT